MQQRRQRAAAASRFRCRTRGVPRERTGMDPSSPVSAGQQAHAAKTNYQLVPYCKIKSTVIIIRAYKKFCCNLEFCSVNNLHLLTDISILFKMSRLCHLLHFRFKKIFWYFFSYHLNCMQHSLKSYNAKVFFLPNFSVLTRWVRVRFNLCAVQLSYSCEKVLIFLFIIGKKKTIVAKSHK